MKKRILAFVFAIVLCAMSALPAFASVEPYYFVDAAGLISDYPVSEKNHSRPHLNAVFSDTCIRFCSYSAGSAVHLGKNHAPVYVLLVYTGLYRLFCTGLLFPHHCTE